MAEQPTKTAKDISNELSSKLQNRPSAKEAGLDIKLAPMLQATAKKLDTQQKKDIVDKNLKTRSSAKDAGVDDKIAPRIQSTAKALSNKIRRDSLKSSLSSRPEIIELIDSGILKPYSQSLANSLQLDAAKLEAALATQVNKEYLQQLGILNPYKKNVDIAPIDIEAASGVLLRALVYRPSPIDTAMVQKQGTEFGFAQVSPSLQTTAKSLDVQRKKDALSSALKARPGVEAVMDKNVTQLGYDAKAAPTLQQTIKDLGREMIKDTLTKCLKQKKADDKATEEERKSRSPPPYRRRASSFDADQLAPRLQGIANKLAMEQKKDTLKEQLNKRPHARSLMHKKILRPYATSLAARLQLNADILEQQLAIRMDEERLKELGILEPYKKHVDTTSIADMDVESKANLILKSLAKQRQRRESGGDLIAPVLTATASQLEKKLTKDALKHKLAAQPKKKDVQLIAPSLGDDSVAPSLQAVKKQLETAQKADAISKTLQTRPQSAQEVGVDMKISPAIQSIAKALASKLRRDSLNVMMSARPDVRELMDSGILKPYSQTLANSLQLDAARLEAALASQVPKSYLTEIGVLEPEKKYVDRTHIDVEKASGLLLTALVLRAKPNFKRAVSGQTSAFGFSDSIAPTLQQVARHLDVQQTKDKLSAALDKRPSHGGVMDKQATQLGYDVKAAPSLQQTIKDLGREMVKNALEKALRRRPSAEEIGVDVKSAAKIQSAMHDLAMSQKRDSVSKSMKHRPSAEEAGVDTQLARGLQGIAKTLEMEMKSDQMGVKLSALGIIKKVHTESVIATLDACIEWLGNYKL